MIHTDDSEVVWFVICISVSVVQYTVNSGCHHRSHGCTMANHQVSRGREQGGGSRVGTPLLMEKTFPCGGPSFSWGGGGFVLLMGGSFSPCEGHVDSFNYMMYADDTTLYFNLDDFNCRNLDNEINSEIEKINL